MICQLDIPDRNIPKIRNDTIDRFFEYYNKGSANGALTICLNIVTHWGVMAKGYGTVEQYIHKITGEIIKYMAHYSKQQMYDMFRKRHVHFRGLCDNMINVYARVMKASKGSDPSFIMTDPAMHYGMPETFEALS